MAVITVEGLGQVEIAGDEPTPQEVEGIKAAMASAKPEKSMLGAATDWAGAAIVGAGQRASGGFSDEIFDRYAAGLGSLVTDKPYEQILAEKRAKSQADIAAFEQRNPNAYMAGEIGGAVVSSLPAAKALQGAAYAIPKAIGLGGVSEAIYSFGKGTGDAGERAKDMLGAGAAGLAGGAAGVAAARPLTFAAKSVFERLIQPAAKAVMPTPKPAPRPETSPVMESPAPKFDELKIAQEQMASQLPADLQLSMAKGEIVRLPAGVRSENVDMLRAEETARQGTGPLREAATKMYETTQGDVMAVGKKLGFVEESADLPNALLERATKTLQRRAAAEQRYMGAIMKARDNAAQKAYIMRDYAQETLIKDLDDAISTPSIMAVRESIGAQKELIKPLEDLVSDFRARVVSPRLEPKIDPITKREIAPQNKSILPLDEVLSFNSKLANMARTYSQSSDAGQRQAAIYIGEVKDAYEKSFNDWMEGAAQKSILNADEKTLEQIYQANQKYAAFKKKTGTNKRRFQDATFEKVLRSNTDMTPTQAANALFGGATQGKAVTEQYVKRAKQLLPAPQYQKFADAAKAGYVTRAFSKALTETAKSKNFAFGTLTRELKKLKANPAYYNQLATAEEKNALDALIKDLGQYASQTGRKDVMSTSGTGGFVTRALDGVLKVGQATPLLSRSATFFRSGLGKYNEMVSKQEAEDLMQKNIREFMLEAQRISNAPTSSFALGGASAGNAMQEEGE